MSKMRKVVWLMIAAVLLMAAFFLYWLTWNGSTKEIESVANELKAEPGWKLVTDQVIPDKTVCLDGNACPSVHRSWSIEQDFSSEDLRQLLARSNWGFPIDKDCTTSDFVTGEMPVCSAAGVIRGFSVSVVVWKNSTVPGRSGVGLFIEE